MRYLRSLLIPLLFMLLLFPQMTSAHSKLESSNPAAGSTVTEPLNSITLQFNEDVEPLSTIKVTNDQGDKVPLTVNVSGPKLSGSLEQPLPDGKYTVTWKIVGGDSHPVEGTYSFLVKVPESVSSDDKSKIGGSTEGTVTPANQSDSSNNQEVAKSNSSGVPDIVLLIALLIVIVGLYYYMARKRRK